MMLRNELSRQSCVWLIVAGVSVCCPIKTASANSAQLKAGFAHRDITPKVDGANSVWLAGYGPGRRAESVHDPIFARGVVVSSGDKKIAVVSLDVVGFQYAQVLAVRKELSDFHYVLVASTHNHEGPDVVGLWGPTFVQRGASTAYLRKVVASCVEVVRAAEKAQQPATARYGIARDESLVRDSRKPFVKDDAIKTLAFYDKTGAAIGVLVKWSVHPEAMGSRNKKLTADFPAWTVKAITAKHNCPAVFVVGAIGGLLAPPSRGVLDEKGKELRSGNFPFTAAYGELVAELADRSMNHAKPIELTPMRVSAKQITVPVHNLYYRAARGLKVLRRMAFAWTGDPDKQGPPLAAGDKDATMAIRTEVAFLQLGQLGIPCIPGEIYPELVFGGIEDPAQANVDYPEADKEPIVADFTTAKHWMLIGLANDEIGYIIPKRQWDQASPFAYDRKTGQYGEINSCGPDVAAVILGSLKRCIEAMRD